ncbi:MAG: hypothetical protein LBH34_04790 [Prevotellaceae bacterium]|jgi:cell division protein FtsQ|nr:hypothetical protein [Prevotellaceae bacterium]
MNKKVIITINITFAACLAAFLIISLLYTQKRWKSVLCTKLEVNIIDSAENQFVKKEDVAAILRSSGQAYFGKKIVEISASEMEKVLHSKSLIKKAEVYTSIDGTLHVSILQRKPIARVYASNGRNFYVDYDGYILQPYNAYTSYVPIVNGSIKSIFPNGYKGNMFEYMGKNKINDSSFVKLYFFLKYISDRDFWKAQIEQIYFTSEATIEFIPRVGAQIIRMGSVNNFEYKLRKLLTVYEKGLPISGWNTYDVIDLSYSNQVVCKKR